MSCKDARLSQRYSRTRRFRLSALLLEVSEMALRALGKSIMYLETVFMYHMSGVVFKL